MKSNTALLPSSLFRTAAVFLALLLPASRFPMPSQGLGSLETSFNSGTSTNNTVFLPKTLLKNGAAKQTLIE